MPAVERLAIQHLRARAQAGEREPGQQGLPFRGCGDGIKRRGKAHEGQAGPEGDAFAEQGLGCRRCAGYRPQRGSSHVPRVRRFFAMAAQRGNGKESSDARPEARVSTQRSETGQMPRAPISEPSKKSP